MNSKKIEMGAILNIKTIIYRHEFMEDYINSNDKEPSWDGYIYLYKNKDLKVEDILYRVPVQIKGKNNENMLKKRYISYPIEYKHLRNYYNDGGVFYLVVVLSDDGRKETLFYNSLTTIKLADLLKGKENKKADSTKSVTLQRLEEDYSNNLYKLLLQLGLDRENQGSGRSEIVKKAINIDVMDKVDCIKATSYFAKNEADIIKEIVTGEISLYGHRSDLDMWCPFDYAQQKEIIFKQVIKLEKSISIDEVVYYDYYYVERTSEKDDQPIIRVSENLVLDLFNGKILFELKGNLKSLVRDVNFLNALNVGKTIYFNNKNVFHISNVNLADGLQEKVEIVLDFADALKEIGFEVGKKFSDFTNENYESMSQLVNVYRRKIVPKKGNEYAWYMWYWDEKLVPIFLGVNEDKIEVINWFTTQEYVVCVTEGNKTYLMPNYALFKRNIYEKLYDVEESIWVKEIEKLENVEQIKDALSQCFVELLAAYDLTQNQNYYNAANRIVDKILNEIPEDEYAIINKMQLIKRKGALSEEQIVELEGLEQKTEDISVKCAVNILLENRRKATKLVKELPEETQEKFKHFPIYNLL